MVFNCLSYNEFLGLFTHTDEIQSFGQICDVDRLILGGEMAS